MKFKTDESEVTVEVITETPEETPKKDSLKDLHIKRLKQSFSLIRSCLNNIEDSISYLCDEEGDN